MTDKRKPPFLHVVGKPNGKQVLGDSDSGLEGEPGLDGSESAAGSQAVDQVTMEVRLGLMELAKDRKYTGYHLILHRYDPETDDESWEAVTQGMTLKDLVFAASNMQARILDLMSSAQEIPGPDSPEK